MKAKTKFKEIYNKLPEKARVGFTCHINYMPYTWNPIALEVQQDTKLGKLFLKRLGFEDD